ncbi:MAG: acyltransferase family protein, partial [Planctomycetaceae bacterium]
MNHNAAKGRDSLADSPSPAGEIVPASQGVSAGVGGEVARAAGRLLAIDGLRGLACLGVAVYHLTRYGATAEIAREGIPAALAWVADHGWVGVQMFFVISGFVIAHTLRDAVVDGWYVGNYALRRSLRLDPPYWVTIGLVLAMHAWFAGRPGWVSPLDIPTPLAPPLSWWLVASHLLYIHKLQGFDSLSAGFWTLTIEIQFYLLYVCALGVSQSLKVERGQAHRLLLWLLLPLAPLSLWWLSPEPRGDSLVFHHFFLFFSGCLAGWAFDGLVSHRWLWGWQAVLALTLVAEVVRAGAAWDWEAWFSNRALKLWAGVLTPLWIDWAGRTGRLARPLPIPGLNAIGRISYSLYLVHFPVAILITTLLEHSPWAPRTPRDCLCVLALSLLVGIGVAWGMYGAIEAPSQRLA